MLFLGLLCCILYTIYPVSGVWDQKCVDNCSCCKDKKCVQGFFPNSCVKGCIDGHRGARCYELCQYENCKRCEDISTICEECYDGYHLGEKKDCTSQCPSNCKSCTSSTMCSKCKEGFYDENGSTTCAYAHCPVNCQCISGQKDCVSCIHGFYDTSTSCSKKCPVNCLTCESEESCNECKSGFYNGYEYDNNINIQLNNCSYACRDTCTECQSYNNCLQCMEGKYGQTCQDCPINCAGGICERNSGTCNDCNENFQGEKCAECIFGNYGPNCNETCSKYCANKNCDRATSKCIYGCMMGYSGDRCCLKSEHCVECTNNTECRKCESGYFKNSCNEKCPEHCLGPCDIMTGECSNCPYNRFGQFCEYNCSENCRFKGGNHNKVCAQSEGTCINGCDDGYFGRTCNETCKCFCVKGQCRQDDGVCTKGCYGHQEEPECTLIETQKDDDHEAGKTSAIELLGALFAVSSMVNIVQGVYIFVKQRKEDGLRQSLNVNYENQMVSSASRFSPNNDQEHEYLTIENTYHAANTRSLR